MAHRNLNLILTLSLISGVAVPHAQTSTETRRPSFAGAWRPSDPARSEQFFSVGLGWVPGDGHIVIEQASNRLTVTMEIPDAKLDRLLAVQGELYTRVVYAILDTPIRGSAGYAAASGQDGSWQGSRLVLSQKQIGIRRITVYLSMDGDRLKMETYVKIVGEDMESTTPEWFERI